MDRIRSALFLDFDNIFGGLLALDRVAAMALATEPLLLVEGLGRCGLDGQAHRDLLIRRAYLNPHGRVYDEDLGNENHWLYLQQFRPHLTRAGFEVVDCPPLTAAHKNAADIRIVIDALTALNQTTFYDEIIVASSDADFTPLLQKIRAADRRTTIIAAGPAAPAYEAVAHTYMNEEALIEILVGTEVDQVLIADDQSGDGAAAQAGTSAAIISGTPTAPGDPTESTDVRRLAADLLNQYVAEADEPVHLASAGNHVHNNIGDDGSSTIKATNWFGTGSLSAFAHAESDGRLHADHLHLWDSQRHEPPVPSSGLDAQTLPPLVSQVCAITGMPRLPCDRWPPLFQTLADYTATHPFHLTQATAWARDQLAQAGTPVGRQALGFVVRGATFGGVGFTRTPAPSADEIRESFLRSMIERAESAGLELTEQDRAELADWLSGNPATVPEEPHS